MYKVLFNYHTEGYSFLSDNNGDIEFATVDEAVKAAITYPNSDFQIVEVINWEARISTTIN